MISCLLECSKGAHHMDASKDEELSGEGTEKHGPKIGEGQCRVCVESVSHRVEVDELGARAEL